jgi:hypothetical protein
MKKLISLMVLILALALAPLGMAADTIVDGTNTWIIDSTGAKDLPWSSVDIIWILWTGCTTDGHDLEVREATGGKIIVLDDDGESGVPHLYPALGVYSGINVITLGSGRLVLKVWNPMWGKRPCY